MSTSLSRDEQVSLGKKIEKMIQKGVGIAFTVNYQGSTNGKVAIMVIIGSSVSFISDVKSYLWKDFHISPAPMPKHGNIKTTVVIKLAELSAELIEGVKTEFFKVFPECKSKVAEVKVETPVEVKAEIHRKAMPKLTKFRSGISSFTTNVFEFENKFLPESEKRDVKNLFNFCKEKDDSLQTLTCKDDMIAAMIEDSLQWLIDGDDPKIICRKKAEIIVDYSELPTNLSRNHPGENFCFRPSRGAGSVEIGSRISRIASSPAFIDIYAVDSTDTFLVKYVRKSSAHKMLILLKDMGWNVWVTDKGELIVCTKPLDTDENQSSSIESAVSEPVIAEDNIPSVSEIEIVHKEEGTSTDHWLAAPGVIHPETVGSALCTVNDRNEAFIELNKLYLNDSLFSKLSSEMQDEIKGTLKNYFQEEKTAEYAQMLLDAINKK